MIMINDSTVTKRPPISVTAHKGMLVYDILNLPKKSVRIP